MSARHLEPADLHPNELVIELRFSRALVDSPDFVRIAKRKFNRELDLYSDTTVYEDDLAIEQARVHTLKAYLADQDAEIDRLQATITELMAEAVTER